jgi:hypothetical protein
LAGVVGRSETRRRKLKLRHVRRLLDIAVLDTLGLDDSVARSPVLVGAAAAAAKLIEAEREASFGWEDR